MSKRITNHFRSIIRQKILNIRESLAVSQPEFVEIFNRRYGEKDALGNRAYYLNQPSLSRYETGRVIPPADIYEAILSMDYTRQG
jgi:hypothetical protein